MIDRIIFYIVIGLTLLGCSSDSEEGGEFSSVPLIQIFQEFNSLEIESTKRLTVVTNEEIFQKEWVRLSAEQAPSIDFSSVSVVIAEMGTQTSTGVSQITVQSAVSNSEFTEIDITSFVPGESCTLDASLSTPFHIVAVESTKQILFIEQQEIVDCG